MEPVMQIPTNVIEFAIWLALNGLTIAMLLEQIPAWKTVSSRAKRIIVFLLAFGMPYVSDILVNVLKSLTPDVLGMIQHYVNLGAIGLRVWATSQYFHGWDPLRQSSTKKVVDGVPSAG